MKTHNYVFIQIVWGIFGYDVIQTICFFFLEKSSRLLWAKKQAHVSSAVGAYWNPCVLNRKFNKKWNNYILFILPFYSSSTWFFSAFQHFITMEAEIFLNFSFLTLLGE